MRETMMMMIRDELFRLIQLVTFSDRLLFYFVVITYYLLYGN
jgi:hypothetical protein